MVFEILTTFRFVLARLFTSIFGTSGLAGLRAKPCGDVFWVGVGKEHGVSQCHIQQLPGHGSSNTTQIYTHISNVHRRSIDSPLDRLFGE